MLDKEVNRPHRVHGAKYFRILHDAVHAENSQRQEPQQHHRRKQFANNAGAVFLNNEKQRQDSNR
ncbi:hypothetical protein SRABI106_02491 [Rahnella aquatilis]|nr:hypothetical protein SRABI106_02491 [Rahnella aquatilis]